MKRYLRCVKGIDDNLGKVFDYLDASGLATNTLVLYTSDQGHFLGEHGIYDKRFMYEESLRAPLLVRWPGQVKPGSVNRDLVANVDFAPMLLAAAGHAIPPDMQGRSFLPLLRDEPATDWREAFYYRYYLSHFQTPPHYGVRTATHKLIHFHTLGEWELYDLLNDPGEMNNLAGDPAQASLLKTLKEQLSALQRQLQDDPNDHGDRPKLP